ncbi:MAG: hypothetical protein J1E38_07355 [Paramuribaculum sp.]|nr:hypothetical protein [Paramuribaculum sp.]
MNKVLGVTCVAALALAVTGCNKKMNQFEADYFSTNPNPLELVGTQVPATITGRVPAKFFVKNASVTVTPVLVYGNYQSASAPAGFQGEKVRGNYPVINYDNGGTVTIPVNFPFTDAMLKSELFLDFNVTQGNKQYVLPRVKVANGVIATADLASPATVQPAIAPDKFQRVIQEKYSAEIKFLINKANIRPDQLTTPQMEAFNSDLRSVDKDPSKQITELNISSYASPDGSYEFNTRLAEQREINTQAYLEGKLKKDGITEFGELTSQFTPEDWEGFQQLVAASNIQDKELILSVLSMYKDPEEREREIRNLSNVFETLEKEIMPQLRYSRMTATIEVIGKSDAEINQLFDTDPSKLTDDELLYAATLTDNIARKKAIYEAATKIYPTNYRGYNNLAAVEFEQGDYEAAKNALAEAAKLNPRSPEVQMNQGLLDMVFMDYPAANRAFGNAAGLPDLGDALGVYYLKQGDTSAAVKAFGNSKTNNAAVAQILAEDYSKAKTTLSGISKPDATTYYLMAVVGARTGNSQMVLSNLRQAVKLDPEYAKRAMNDLEFARFNLSGAL